MGSGYYGSGGSGSSGGGGGTRGGYGGYGSGGGGSQQQVRDQIRLTFINLPNTYLDAHFGSSLTRSAYEELLTLGRCIRADDPVQALTGAFGVDDDSPHFLPRVVAHLAEKYEPSEPDARVRETVRTTLEDSLIRLLGDDVETYLNGTRQQILDRAEPGDFEPTRVLPVFLGGLIFSIVEREYERQRTAIRAEERRGSEEIADETAKRAEEAVIKEGLAYPDSTFEFFQREPKWIREELRR